LDLNPIWEVAAALETARMGRKWNACAAKVRHGRAKREARLARAFAQMSRPSTCSFAATKEDLDARHKTGHGGFCD
jgi:hypothetical protein